MSTDMVCIDVVELLNDFLEGTLSPEEHAHVQTHLDGCDGCTTVLEQLRIAIATTGRLNEDGLPEDQRATLLAAFRHHIRGE
jgi:predicted anti-sigma-YlaC factor YlaD